MLIVRNDNSGFTKNDEVMSIKFSIFSISFFTMIKTLAKAIDDNNYNATSLKVIKEMHESCVNFYLVSIKTPLHIL